MSETILSVKDLTVSFNTIAGKVQAVRGISFDLKKVKLSRLLENLGLVNL